MKVMILGFDLASVDEIPSLTFMYSQPQSDIGFSGAYLRMRPSPSPFSRPMASNGQR
jgi:hypothetical protein